MQLVAERREVSSHGVMQIAKATVVASAQVFNQFENQYSDRFKAIVREMTANGIDSHRQAGTADPVHIYLPDALDPYYRVKDTGLGMSHLFCTTGFMAYSNGSTKNGDNIAIGGFGTGSKSGFAYTDQLTLRSVHDGIRSTYSMFKDEDGCPCLGLLEQVPTDEINGVEFSIPVEPKDFEKFRNAAVQHLAYFGDEVRLHGAQIDTVDYVQQGAGWGIRPRNPHNHTPQVVMGGMAYPINRYDLDYPHSSDSLAQIPIDLILPIGACSVTPNREALLYDDKTKVAIVDALDAIRDEVTANMPTMFDHITSQWEACVALDEHLGYDKNNAWARLVLQHVQWGLQPLTPYFKPTTGQHWHIEARNTRRKRSYSSSKCGSPSWVYISSQIQPAKIAKIIIDDLPPHKSPIKRIKTFVDDCAETDEFLVIRNPDITLEMLGNPPADLVMRTSELPEIAKATRTARTSAYWVRPRVRMFKPDEYRFNEPDYRIRVTPRQYTSPVTEIDYANQPNTGILVVMENFELPPLFRTKMDAGLIQLDELYLVNKADAQKLTDTWEMFDAVFAQRLANTLAEMPNAPQWKALLLSPLEPLIKFINCNPEMFDSIAKNTPLARLCNLIQTYKTDIPRGLGSYIVEALPPRVDPDDLLARINTQHWQLMTLQATADRRTIPTDSNLFKLFKEII
jgi:hypothetical protein